MQSGHEDYVPPRGTPLEGGWLAMPFLATLGSYWAFSLPEPAENLTTLAIALALVVGGWQVLWLTLTLTHWAAPLARWRAWQDADPLPPWPYLQSGAPGAALHRRLSQAHAWWRHVGQAALARPLKRSVVALFVMLLLGAALGRQALLLSLCFLTLTELALLWHEGKEQVGALWEGLALVGLPWMLGATVVEGDVLQLVVSGLALALTIGIFAQRSWWALFGPALGAAYLIWQRQETAAGWLLLLTLPGFLVLAQQPSADGHRRALGPWAIGIVVLVAGVL